MSQGYDNNARSHSFAAEQQQMLLQQQQRQQRDAHHQHEMMNEAENADAASNMDVEDFDVEMDNLRGPSYGGAAAAKASERTCKDNTTSKGDDMTFCMGNYAKETLKMMFIMRSHHLLTDVIIEVKQEEFPAHKIVLSAASPYFKAMFTSGLKETEMSRIQLQGVCPTAMGRLIYFMYTGHIRITEVTVCQLLPAATMFQVSNVIDACCAFLERQLDPTNAIGIANFAEQYGCMDLQKKANQYIERHFTEICQEEEFLQLSVYQIISLIRRDELNVQEEREVYNAVLKWVKYDPENRYPKMEHILAVVRCQLLTPSFLREQMVNCDVLRKVPACKDYLAKIFKDLTLHKRPMVKQRTPNTTRIIYVAGGFLNHSLDTLEAFNVDDGTWTSLPNLRGPRSGLGAAFLKGTFYAVGGRNNCIGTSYDSDWVDRYNSIAEHWRTCAPMSVPRHRVGVAVMDELLYAVGGSAGSEYHNSCEFYDPEFDRWTLVASMHTSRLGVCAAVVNRLLYAIGGFDGNERLNTVECYHPENNKWSYVAPMHCCRSGAGVAVINQYIYVVGGFDGRRQLSSVERYDTENNVWEFVAPVKVARSALSVTPLDGCLYAIGGFDGANFLAIVEVYDPATNTWRKGTPLSSGRSGHASAVVYQPASLTDYMECSGASSDKKGGDDNTNDDNEDNDNDGGGSGRSKPVLFNGNPHMNIHTSNGASACRNCEREVKAPTLVTDWYKHICNEKVKENLNENVKRNMCHIVKMYQNRKRRSRMAALIESKKQLVDFDENLVPKQEIEDVPTAEMMNCRVNTFSDDSSPTSPSPSPPTSTSTSIPTLASDSESLINFNELFDDKLNHKTKCLFEVVKKYTPGNIMEHFVNSFVEKHCKRVSSDS